MIIITAKEETTTTRSLMSAKWVPLYAYANACME